MGLLSRLGSALHAAIARPFRPAPVDYAERDDFEQRRERIVRKLDRLREVRAAANVERRDAGWNGS